MVCLAALALCFLGLRALYFKLQHATHQRDIILFYAGTRASGAMACLHHVVLLTRLCVMMTQLLPRISLMNGQRRGNTPRCIRLGSESKEDTYGSSVVALAENDRLSSLTPARWNIRVHCEYFAATGSISRWRSRGLRASERMQRKTWMTWWLDAVAWNCVFFALRCARWSERTIRKFSQQLFHSLPGSESHKHFPRSPIFRGSCAWRSFFYQIPINCMFRRNSLQIPLQLPQSFDFLPTAMPFVSLYSL